jgi:hypothetical protein
MPLFEDFKIKTQGSYLLLCVTIKTDSALNYVCTIVVRNVKRAEIKSEINVEYCCRMLMSNQKHFFLF